MELHGTTLGDLPGALHIPIEKRSLRGPQFNQDFKMQRWWQLSIALALRHAVLASFIDLIEKPPTIYKIHLAFTPKLLVFANCWAQARRSS